jgi:AbrB family looped-hinge helix DNA binding protein
MAFINGKMPFVDAIAEIDKAGRLVVPKKLRDALHLVPGTRLTLIQKGNAILVQTEAKPRGLYRKNGILVYDSGQAVPPDSVEWLKADREERMDKVEGKREKV